MKPEMLWPFALIALILWLVFRIRYTVDNEYVRVVVFGVTVRRIALSDIEFADTAAPFWNEHWCNTLCACGRIVRLRRKSGLVRNFIITPVDRDAFLAELRSKLGR